jgi:hypothetical protein
MFNRCPFTLLPFVLRRRIKRKLFIHRQRGDWLALHRLNERRVCVLPNCLVFRRLCLRLLDISRRAEL